MANNPWNVLGSYQFTSSVDQVNDSLPFWQSSTQEGFYISLNTLLNITGSPVGTSDTQTLTNKTLTSPTISGPTLSGTITGTYTIGGTPTFPSSVVQLTSTQTLTNKTLTSPTINSPTITNATITADTVSGYTTSNNGTIYGMSVTGGVLASAALAGAVNTAALATNAVGGANLATNAIKLGSATITSNFTTTSTTTYVDVTGLSATVTVPSGGRDVKITTQFTLNTSGAAGTTLTVCIREGTTELGKLLFIEPVTAYGMGAVVIADVAAPTAGSHTYKVSVSQSAAGTLTVFAGSTSSGQGSAGPALLLVEAI